MGNGPEPPSPCQCLGARPPLPVQAAALLSPPPALPTLVPAAAPCCLRLLWVPSPGEAWNGIPPVHLLRFLLLDFLPCGMPHPPTLRSFISRQPRAPPPSPGARLPFPLTLCSKAPLPHPWTCHPTRVPASFSFLVNAFPAVSTMRWLKRSVPGVPRGTWTRRMLRTTPPAGSRPALWAPTTQGSLPGVAARTTKRSSAHPRVNAVTGILLGLM